MVIETSKSLLEARMLNIRYPILYTEFLNNSTNSRQMLMINIRKQMMFNLEVKTP